MLHRPVPAGSMALRDRNTLLRSPHVWQEHHIVSEDLDRIGAATYIPWQAVHGKTMLVTGATGLIGSSLVRALLWYGAAHDAGLRVLALTRNRARAEASFAGALAAGAPLSVIEGNVETLSLDEPV